jgi:hypothetical protein
MDSGPTNSKDGFTLCFQSGFLTTFGYITSDLILLRKGKRQLLPNIRKKKDTSQPSSLSQFLVDNDFIKFSNLNLKIKAKNA